MHSIAPAVGERKKKSFKVRTFVSELEVEFQSSSSPGPRVSKDPVGDHPIPHDISKSWKVWQPVLTL